VADLVLGPLLRRVDATSAVVWVETDAPCDVRVLDAHAPTFTVHGHHYALVDVGGLTPGTSTAYTVALDDHTVWPEPGAPPSVIRTPAPGGPVGVLFGSCRVAAGHDPAAVAAHGPDALRACARRLAADPSAAPTVLLLVGDQVYADAESPEMTEFIRARRDITRPPGTEIADFEEYAHLYHLAFGDPDVRWLLSTVPTLMIFDDHDIRDDWNTSQAWRDDIRAQPWWRARVTAGLAAYAVYQHLGNLPRDVRAADPIWRRLHEGGDAGDRLDAFAWHTDSDPEAYRWSYHQDYGGTRLVVVDSRCARVLTPGARAMLDPGTSAWLDGLCTGDRDHLLIATSLPYLMPRAVYDLEAWNEALADGRWGAWARRTSERLRRRFDLEHWAAFHRSSTALARTVMEVAAGRRGRAPASVVFLSGDVHHSYLTTVTRPRLTSEVHQAVCSPIRNPLRGLMRTANQAAAHAPPRVATRLLTLLAGVRPPPWRWRLRSRPWFTNSLATLRLDARTATITWESPNPEATTLTPVRRAALTADRPSPPRSSCGGPRGPVRRRG
jgi:hypothetical protein